MSKFEQFLRKCIPFKEIGWKEIGEKFTRYQLFKAGLFNIYLHQLYAPNWTPKAHDHPWSFITILLKGGYIEKHDGIIEWHSPGEILHRNAEFIHSIMTPSKTSWSLVITGPKKREWSFKDYED